MTADAQLRDRLERATRHVTVDTGRQLERIHGAAQRRGRGRRLRALAVAAVIAVIAVVLVWQLRPPGSGEVPAEQPTGRITHLIDPGEDGLSLFDLDVASGDVSALAEETDPVLWADRSADGSRLAYVVEEPGPRYAIVVADADGSNAVTIVEDDGTGAVGPDIIDLSWSPDGSRIAYSGRVVEGGVARRTILVVNADGSGRPQALDGLWTGVDWSPDGERLLLEGFSDADLRLTGDERFDLYSARPDGSDLVQLTNDGGIEHQSSWSPDGTRIVFAVGDTAYAQDVFVMDADGSGVRRLTDWEGVDLTPVWSPDGHWIAFLSDRDATAAEQARNRSGEETFTGLALYVVGDDGSGDAELLENEPMVPVAWTP